MTTWLIAVPPLIVLFGALTVFSLCARVQVHAHALAQDVSDLDRLVAASQAMEKRLTVLDAAGRDLALQRDL